ncbi:TPA: hypothetical protein R1765_001980 [Campylobacter coli]|nr:hypothetical protein [Campylobacter coli]
MLLSRINPSVVLPGLLVPQTQNVDFDAYIGQKTNLTDTADEMLYIMTVNNINSETSVGQQWGQELTNQSYSLGQTGLPLYRVSAYVEYDQNEQAKFERLSNGVSLPAFLENLAKQGINQRKHQGILYGFDNGLKQGITSNATVVNMPADSNSKTKLTEYDPAELVDFLASIARSVMDTTYGTAKPVVFASSVRVINYIKTVIVPLLDSANANGVDSVSGLYNRVISEWLGVGKIQFIADELLRENTTDGKDTIMMIAPGLDNQSGLPDDINQNLVGEFNSITYNTMYDAGIGLTKMNRPDDFGIYSSWYTYKMTPGATLRSEAVVTCAVQYA